MNDMLERQKSEFEKKRSRRKLWHKTVSALAAVTVFVTAYSLILPAITMESPACGKEEHTHTQECYEVRSILTCGQEETPGHKHDETCYDTEGNLICGQEEKEGHTHTAECYTTEKILVCDKEEHVHDESCYPQKHVKDPSVNEETREQWESTFSHLTLTGDWAKDVLAIADTQLGYTESASNYITEDGRRKGYTRYGAWYGDSYGDWGAMFVSFCLHYACVDTDLMPVEADCRRWTDKLGAMQNYRDRDYVPEPGDVVFFEGEKDGRSDHAGLVYEIIKDADGNPVQIITIEGNSSESVQYAQYALTDTDIAGYGKLPRNPERSESTKESKEEETVTEEKENTDNTDSDEDKVENDEAPAVLTATAENGVTVTMTAPKESLPASAEELSLTASVVEDKDAKELIEKEVSENDGADVRRKSMLFDIKLMYNGEEAQPAGPVGISFTGIDTPKDDAQVFHVDGQARKAEEVTASEKRDGTITAETDHFSVYGVTFTVDFHFGDYTWSILGKSEILLSELFANLKIGRSASDVMQAMFSNPKLISVEKTADDWKLTSLKAFKTKETLTVTFSNGDELVIEVTDAPAGGIAENYVPNTAKVTALNISKVTGTAPWDANNDPGNDKDASNDVVRSFDNIFYNVGYTLNLIDRYQGLFSGYKKANLYVRATLPLTKEQATFDLSGLSWMSDVQVTDNGNSQTLTGYYALDAGDKAYAIPSTGTLKLVVAVKNMANGTKVNLSEVKCWLDTGKDKTVTPTDTTVSSKTNYNVGIKDFTWDVGTADYATGNIIMNSENTPYHGSIESYGVYVSVVKDAKKGDKGLFVEDTINCEFDLKAYEFYFNGIGYVPLANTMLWDCSLYTEEARGTQNREMFYMKMGNGNNKYRLPYSRKDIGDRTNSVFDSGTISVESRGSNTYHVKFSGIKTDGIFPTNGTNGDMIDGGQNMIATGVVEVYQPFHWNGATPAGGPTVKRYTDVCTDGTFKINNQTHDDPNAVFQPEIVSDNRNFLLIIYGGTGDASLYVSLRDNATIHVGDKYTVSVHGNAFPTATYGFVHEDIFVKFDGRVFDVDESSIQANTGLEYGVPLTNPYFSTSVYYVGLNQAGWDGLDRMRYYNPSNYAAGGFQLFSSMDELRAALGQDAFCCGLYFKIRNIDIAALQRDDRKYGYYNDYETVGALFDLVAKSNEGFDGPVTHILASSIKYRADWSVVETDYDRAWPNYDVPTGATYVLGSYYYPAVYDSNGNCIRNARYDITADSDSTNWRSGKTVYILGEECRTEQRIANDQSGESKQTYFVSSGERYADYALRPKTLFGGNHKKIRDVTVTATLDKGLSYIPDTAYLGGTYIQPADFKHSGSVTGGVKLRDNGTVANAPTSATTIGNVNMTIVENADGTTTLTWRLTNVELGKEIPVIYYSTKIGDETNPGNDVRDGETLKSVAMTYTADSGIKDEYSSTTSLKVIALGSATIIDGVMKDGVLHPDMAEFDVDEDITYTIDYINDSEKTLTDMNILDLLPYNGDLRGSTFHGSYTVDAVTVERLNDVAGSYALDYTTDTSVHGHENDLFGITPAYTTATASVAGRITTLKLPANTSPTLLNIKGTNVGAYAKVRITVTLHPTGNKDGDTYHNDAGYNTQTIPAPVYAAPVYAKVVQQKAALKITKTVIGAGTGSFPFEVLFTDANGDPVKIPDDTASPKSYEVSSASPYKVSFSLKNGESVTLQKIPVGTRATITETKHDGYTVLIKDTTAGGTVLSKTDTATVTVTTDKEVEVINNPGVVLPSAGGGGTYVYTFGGGALCLAAIITGFRLRRRRERRAGD